MSSMQIQGIDLSHWNSKIDWAKVGAAGIRFALLKCTDNDKKIDVEYDAYAKAAAAEGIPIGAYCYSRMDSVDEAQREARYIVAAIAKTGIKPVYPVALDVEEGNTFKMGKAKITEAVNAFAAIVADAGYIPALYTSRSAYLSHVDAGKLDKRVQRWIASHNPDAKGKEELAQISPHIWQYSKKGKVAGISTDADMNYSYVDYAAQAGGSVQDKPPVEVPAPAPAFSLARTLRRRVPMMRGEDVKAVQAALIAKGYSCGRSGADGKFGKDTAAAVRNFQRASKITVDGIVGKNTTAKLGGVWKG